MALQYFALYFLVSSFLTVALLVYLFFKEKFNYWKNRNVPYLQPTIPFGNALDIFLGKITYGELYSNAYLEFKRRGHKHGGIYFFWIPRYIPVDEKIIKRVLITDFDIFSNHGFYSSDTHDPLTSNIFNMVDSRWKSVRAKMPGAFTSAKMKKMLLIMTKYSDVFIKKLKELDQGEVDIKQHLTKLSVDTAFSCMFGTETNTMSNENSELIRHGRLFFDYQWCLFRISLGICFPRRFLENMGFRVFTKETNRYIFKLFEDIKAARADSNSSRNDLTDAIIKMTRRDENEKDFMGKTVMEPLTTDEYTAQMLIFFGAGFETTSSTLTFGLYEIAKNLDIQTKLREEIATVLARFDNTITYDAVAEMKYLDNVVDEILRLYPVFPIVQRVGNRDYVESDTGVIIEKGISVNITNLGLHRDPEYYPDPLRFDPDRFLNENKAKRPFVSYLPFGEGPRICIGKRFGLNQVKVTLVNIIRNFEVTLGKRTSSSFRFESDELLLRKAGDIWLNLNKIS